VSLLSNLRAPGKPLLCYVTDRRTLPGVAPETSLAALAQKIQQVASAGVDWVQIREKDLTARELALLTREAFRSTAASSIARSVRILVNDRLDIALADGVGGVHLGEKSLPVAAAKRLVESALRKRTVDESFLVGVSCHSIEAAAAAERDGADYIFFGPIFATPSKQGFGPSQGTERLRQVCSAVSIPVLAIGGITLDNSASCFHAGAGGLAAIRLFQDAPDPVFTVRRLHQLSMDCRPQ
jgi:thiamine-phosphate pyrophosphorylase